MLDVLQTAQRLLALRDRAATPGEAQAAATALARLIEKHRLSIVEIEAYSGVSSEGIIVDDVPVIVTERHSAWRQQLLFSLCAHYGVVAWQKKRAVHGAKRQRWLREQCLCGRSDDIETVRFMYAWISADAVRLSKEFSRGSRGRRAWLVGFASGIEAQLRAVRQESFSTTSSHTCAMVLARNSHAAEFLRRALGSKLQDEKSNWKAVNRTAYVNGQTHGASHHLGEYLESKK